jgi:hypothetical protein
VRRVAAATLAAFLLVGCAVGRPTSYTGRSNSFCADALSTIATLTSPRNPRGQMQYAVDRYTALERTVSELTDSALPAGSTGRQLRDRWLRPARTSLADGRTMLGQLQQEVSADDRVGAAKAFETASTVGIDGVDITLLKARGLTRCATLFTAPVTAALAPKSP